MKFDCPPQHQNELPETTQSLREGAEYQKKNATQNINEMKLPTEAVSNQIINKPAQVVKN